MRATSLQAAAVPPRRAKPTFCCCLRLVACAAVVQAVETLARTRGEARRRRRDRSFSSRDPHRGELARDALLPAAPAPRRLSAREFCFPRRAVLVRAPRPRLALSKQEETRRLGPAGAGRQEELVRTERERQVRVSASRKARTRAPEADLFPPRADPVRHRALQLPLASQRRTQRAEQKSMRGTRS